MLLVEFHLKFYNILFINRMKSILIENKIDNSQLTFES